ncbi:MAG TPA: hypothetical protein VK483_06775 [Chitinophagaceae bacterium]|nr:hypothetical protein [Chitinophagaceae bacterium]
MNKSSFVSISIFLLAIFCIKPELSRSQDITGKWTGTMSMEIISQHEFGNSTTRVYLTITENIVTGSVESSSKRIVEGKEVGRSSCTGAGKGELWRVAFNYDAETYDLQAISPLYTCTHNNLILGTTETEHMANGLDLIANDNPMGDNRNVLTGTKIETGDIAGIGKSTTTITWSLKSGPMNAELIVSPDDYDDWLPKPGRDELTKGSVMKINLKVRGINGQPLIVKAKRFELTLSYTSIEPGITINYPVSPRANQLPDLRFLKLGIGESIEEDQFLSIPCNDGSTGKVSIASYDGGGWTVLSVVAILKDDTRIKGHLFVSGGEEEIRIPKRDIGSKIATKWLNENRNPGEMDDKEETDENHNKGDGLTAYEEYRGVMSLDTFRRLDPNKKELGFMIKQWEFGLFKEGLLRFQKASGIKYLLFGRNEIPDNRRLNQNALSAHDFNQFVLRLSKGANNGDIDIYGFRIVAWGLTYPHNDIPARVTHISIDVDRIRAWYQQAVRAYGAANLPFTDKDLIASTTAHEIGHGLSLPHHGTEIPNLTGDFNVVSNPPRVFNADATHSWEESRRPYPIDGAIGSPGNNESGNVSCFMCYRNKTTWIRKTNANNELAYYRVPWLAAGILFCPEIKGTGINAGDEYFGNGIAGNCLGNLKLRD